MFRTVDLLQMLERTVTLARFSNLDRSRTYKKYKFDLVRFTGRTCSCAGQIDQPARYGVIRENPLQTLIYTRNLVGEGWSVQLAHDGQFWPRTNKYGPNCVRDSRDFRAALAILAERGQARMDEDGRRRYVAINPALLEDQE